MKNQKGNVALIAIIVAIVAISASAITWLFFSQLRTPTQKKVATQPVPPTRQEQLSSEETQPQTSNQGEASVPADWKTYSSNIGNALIGLPNDWKLVLPVDGSLAEINKDAFNVEISYGLLNTVSSPDRKDTITFTNGPLDIGTQECAVKFSEIGNQRVKETTCPDVVAGGIPGRYNYEFVDKNLVLVVDNKTEVTNKVISLIKFN